MALFIITNGLAYKSSEIIVVTLFHFQVVAVNRRNSFLQIWIDVIVSYASTFPHTKALPLSIRGKECLR